MQEKLRIAFAGGGTAGHLYPAINLAKIFEQVWPCEHMFFGTLRGIEATKIPQYGYKLVLLNVRGFHRRFSLENILFPFRLLSSLMKSKKALKKFKPHLVIGTGGYVMGPVLKMAIKLRIPVFIQEQNSFPGITTRMLAKQSEAVFVAYGDAKDFLPEEARLVNAGNPVLIKEQKRERKEILESFRLKDGLKTILVFGGSQGAGTINSAISRILEEKTWPEDVQLLWQTGKLQYEKYLNWSKGKHYSNIVITPFIDDMWAAYQISEFCVCRAGAMSLSELAVSGLPAILIPLKSAAGNHQFKNAESLEASGCAALINDDGHLSENLFLKINDWLNRPADIVEMRNRFKNMAQPEAGKMIVHKIREILQEKNHWPDVHVVEGIQ